MSITGELCVLLDFLNGMLECSFFLSVVTQLQMTSLNRLQWVKIRARQISVVQYLPHHH